MSHRPQPRPHTNGGIFSLVDGFRSGGGVDTRPNMGSTTISGTQLPSALRPASKGRDAPMAPLSGFQDGFASTMPLGVKTSSLRTGGGEAPSASRLKPALPPRYTPPSTAPTQSGRPEPSIMHVDGASDGGSRYIPPLPKARLRTPGQRSTTTPNTPAFPRSGSAYNNNNGPSSSAVPASTAEPSPMPQLRRPPSTGGVPSTGSSGSSSGGGGAGSNSTNAAFHKNLVNALQDVLRRQRQGVFPMPHEPHVEASFTMPSLGGGGGSGGGDTAQQATSNAVEEMIRQKKMEWAQRRWAHLQKQEKRTMERDVTSASQYARRMSSSQSRRPTTLPTNDMLFQAPSASQQEDILSNSSSALEEPSEGPSLFEGVLRQEKQCRMKLEEAASRAWSNLVLDPAVQEMFHSSLTRRPLNPANRLSPSELKSEGNRLYERGDFCGAHRAYTAALEMDPHNIVLLTNRGAAHMMLLNYDSCVKDCLAAISMDPHSIKALQRLAKAYAMLFQFRSASKYYTIALNVAAGSVDEHAAPASNGGGGAAGSTTEPQLMALYNESMSVALLEKMRRLYEQEDYAECVQAWQALKAFGSEPPVMQMRGIALIATDPMLARTELSKYVGTLDPPQASQLNGSTASSDVILTSLFVMHYCESLSLLAKASFYCGHHYVKLAMQYVKQCTSLRPEFRQAVQLGKVLTALETRMVEASDHLQRGRFAEAHAALTLALALDPNNKKIRSGLLVSRSEISVKIGNVAAAISDCTAALECDTANVKALTRRAKCFQDIGDFQRAVRDMERAASLNSSLNEDLLAMKRMMYEDASSHQHFQRNFSASRSRQQQAPPPPYSSGDARPGTSGGQGGPMEACLYAVLELPRGATADAVKQQYRKMILLYHPDKVVKEHEAVRLQCAKKFKEISHAYSVLSDAAQKMAYDRNNDWR